MYQLISVLGLALSGFMAWFVIKKDRKKADPDQTLVMRNDTLGDGHYFASRHGREHRGVDIEQDLSDFVYAPFDLEFIRTGITSVDKPLQLGVWKIINNGRLIEHTLKAMYVDSQDYAVGERVSIGMPMGIPEDLHQYYSSEMVQHVHYEIRNELGVLIDPTDYLIR
jgi:hypothetical protein